MYPLRNGPRPLPFPPNQSSADIFTIPAPSTAADQLPASRARPILTEGWKDRLLEYVASAAQVTADDLGWVGAAPTQAEVGDATVTALATAAAFKRVPWSTLGTVSNPVARKKRSYLSHGVSRAPCFKTGADSKVDMEWIVVCKAPGFRYIKFEGAAVGGGICGASVKLRVLQDGDAISVEYEEPCVHRASPMTPEHVKRHTTPIPEVCTGGNDSMGSVQDAAADVAGGHAGMTPMPKNVHAQLLSNLSEMEKLTGNMTGAG